MSYLLYNIIDLLWSYTKATPITHTCWPHHVNTTSTTAWIRHSRELKHKHRLIQFTSVLNHKHGQQLLIFDNHSRQTVSKPDIQWWDINDDCYPQWGILIILPIICVLNHVVNILWVCEVVYELLMVESRQGSKAFACITCNKHHQVREIAKHALSGFRN